MRVSIGDRFINKNKGSDLFGASGVIIALGESNCQGEEFHLRLTTGEVIREHQVWFPLVWKPHITTRSRSLICNLVIKFKYALRKML